MTERLRTFGRRALWALPIWAVMLLLGTLTHQPDPQTALGEFAAYVTTGRFLASHLVNSILGAAVGSIGIVGLMLHLADTRASGRAAWAAALFIAGNTVTAAVFGAAAFAQPAIGRAALQGASNALALYNDVYAAPLFATAVVGLLLFMAGGIIGGIAIAASGRLPVWAGWVFALAVPLFAISNFLVPVGQTVAALALVVATVAVAWSGRARVERRVASTFGDAMHAP